jgi:hypothetical protein
LVRLEQEVKVLKTIRTAKAPYRRLWGLKMGAVYEEAEEKTKRLFAVSSGGWPESLVV